MLSEARIIGKILILVLFVFTPYFGLVALLYMSLYTISPLLTWRVSPEVAEQETKPMTSH